MALKTCTRPAGSVGAYAKVEIRLSQDTVITASGLNYLAWLAASVSVAWILLGG